MMTRRERPNPVRMTVRVTFVVLPILICSLCTALFFASGTAVTLAGGSGSDVHERQITPIIVKSPYLSAPMWL